jgi:glycosyltransferase involved in cell wall biosynthesis
MTPQVSLALPVYNGEQLISEAIRSILAQDFRDFELIITDNASTDGTERICREFAASERRIQYIRNDGNLGASPNFNKSFELSSGKYFKWCAHDDYLSSNYVGRCVSVLETNRDAVLAYGTTQNIDRAGCPIPLRGSMFSNPEGLGPARRFQMVIAEQSSCYEIFGVFRREALEQTTLLRMYYGSDHVLLCQMALLGTFVQVPDIVLYNREHAHRSVNMKLSDQRMWTCTEAKTKDSLLHISHFAHLLEMTFRYRRIASPIKTIPIVLRYELRPYKLSKQILDLIGIALPWSRPWLRKIGWAILDKLRIQLK